MFNVRLAGDHLLGNGCAGDDFGGVLSYVVLFPMRCLG